MHMNYSQIMSPRPPLPPKVGGHDPPAPMGAPPLAVLCDIVIVICFSTDAMIANASASL